MTPFKAIQNNCMLPQRVNSFFTYYISEYDLFSVHKVVM